MSRKILVLLISLILLAFCLTAQEQQSYLEKYSASMPWSGFSGNTEVRTGGNIITEVKIKELLDKNRIITAQLVRTMTPFAQVITADVTMEYSDGGYYFSFTDGWGNKIDGHFAVFNETAKLSFKCKELSVQGKNYARLYIDETELHKTTSEPEFFQTALKAGEIKKQLISLNLYWPMDSENSYLSVNYIGKIKDCEFYCTGLNWNIKSGNRYTKRIVLFKNNEYIGNYGGIRSDKFYVRENVLIVMNGKQRNEIDFSRIIPAYVLIDGDNIVFDTLEKLSKDKRKTQPKPL